MEGEQRGCGNGGGTGESDLYFLRKKKEGRSKTKSHSLGEAIRHASPLSLVLEVTEQFGEVTVD